MSAARNYAEVMVELHDQLFAEKPELAAKVAVFASIERAAQVAMACEDEDISRFLLNELRALTTYLIDIFTNGEPDRYTELREATMDFLTKQSSAMQEGLLESGIERGLAAVDAETLISKVRAT